VRENSVVVTANLLSEGALRNRL